MSTTSMFVLLSMFVAASAQIQMTTCSRDVDCRTYDDAAATCSSTNMSNACVCTAPDVTDFCSGSTTGTTNVSYVFSFNYDCDTFLANTALMSTLRLSIERTVSLGVIAINVTFSCGSVELVVNGDIPVASIATIGADIQTSVETAVVGSAMENALTASSISLSLEAAKTSAPAAVRTLFPDTPAPAANETEVPEIDYGSPDYLALGLGSGLLFIVLLLACLLLYRLFGGNFRSNNIQSLDSQRAGYHQSSAFEKLHAAPPASPPAFGRLGEPLHTAFTHPEPSTVSMTEVIVKGDGSRTALVVYAVDGPPQKAINLARSMGAGKVRVLSESCPEPATRASILAGLRWLTASATESDTELILIVVAKFCETHEGMGFRPSDFSRAGAVTPANIIEELSLIPTAKTCVVYDVPSPKAAWGFPHCMAPRNCHAPTTNRASYGIKHMLLLSSHGSSDSSALLVESLASMQTEVPCAEVLQTLHSEMGSRNHSTYPVLWSTKLLSDDALFPFPGDSNQYQPPLIESSRQSQKSIRPPPLQRGGGGGGGAPPSPLWTRNLSPHGVRVQSPHSESEDEDAFPSWLGSGRQPQSHSGYDRPTSPSRLSPGGGLLGRPRPEQQWSPVQSRSPLLGERMPSPTQSPPLPVYASQLSTGGPVFPRAQSGHASGPLLSSGVRANTPSMSMHSPRSGSPRNTRSVSPAAAGLSHALYSPRGLSGTPDRVNCLLQSHTSVPHFSYKRATARAKRGRSWMIELACEGEAPIEFSIDDVERCGAEEAGGTDYPDQAMFFVPYDQPRLVVVFNDIDTRDTWISWMHGIKPESVVILPSTFSMPTL